jgi:molybdopterin-guanine dinucleotide biosynthesis protein A
VVGETNPRCEPAHAAGEDMACSAIVLAGGASSRLGTDKAFLSLDGQPLVARTVHKLAALSDDLIVVTNEPAPYEPLALPVRLVPDERPGFGSLMGIYSGLKKARHSRALVVACDMPFLSLPLLRHMLPLAQGYDVVIPALDGLLEPLHAIYGNACLPAIAQLLERGERRVVAFFDQVRVLYLDRRAIDRWDPRHLSFLNVNTPEDWARVQELFCEQPPGGISTRRRCRR